MSHYTNEQIYDMRFQASIERFADYEEYIEIPIYEDEDPLSDYQFILQKRLQSAVDRYTGIEEFMEMPDMDLWLSLKTEIIQHYLSKNDSCWDEDDYEYDIEEGRYRSWLDRQLCSSRGRGRSF